MTHEKPINEPDKIRFIERISGATHRAIIRSSIFQPGTLVWVQRQKVQYLDIEDVTALRDFLTKWLRDERKRGKS